MMVLYDGFIYQIQVAGGINRYLANLIARLPSDWTPVLTLKQKRELAFPSHARLKVRRFPEIRPRRFAGWAAETYFAAIEKTRNLDLIHLVYHSSLAGPIVKRNSPIILTIHDMIPELFHDDVDPTGSETESKRRAIEVADAIVCVSENTRRDLLERYRFPADRVFVIHLASELSYDLSLGPELVPERPYFLFVGTRAIYKNFVRLLLAFGRVSAEWNDVELCVVGAAFNATERGLFNALKIRERVRNLGHVSDQHLAKLYRCSAAFIYPSLYEGFGIPPLEAMSCGAVVITSACSSLPEIVGNAAILIDPQSVEELTAAMLSIRDLGAQRRNEIIRQGADRAKLYDWNTTAHRTLEVYRNVAGCAID